MTFIEKNSPNNNIYISNMFLSKNILIDNRFIQVHKKYIQAVNAL